MSRCLLITIVFLLTSVRAYEGPEYEPARIQGGKNATVTGELYKPLLIRCLGHDYPASNVYWTRNKYRLPINDTVYEIKGNSLLIRSLRIVNLGEYSCHADNGVGNSTSWSVLVFAYEPEDFPHRYKYLVNRTLLVTATTSSTSNTYSVDTIMDNTSTVKYSVGLTNNTISSNTSSPSNPTTSTTSSQPEDVTEEEEDYCKHARYGCCSDNQTPAHGPNFEGCCLLNPFNCCPDNRLAAKGPHFEGCGCQYTQNGCCPDNVTAAGGPNNEGCGCQHTEFGCCPDRHTVASGPEFEGCSCLTYQFGCCPDGVTIATSPDQQSCRCEHSTYGCCGDAKTPATGPNGAGCDCSTSQYGCCPDGQTEAAGAQFQGCATVPENKQAVCSLPLDGGSCSNYTVMYFYDRSFGGCSRFWYRGCDGNGNKFTTKEDCEDVCVRPAPKDVCKLPDVKGPCDADHVRWYYNSTREQCLPFRYGGCLGNANNFDSRELCQTKCEPDKTTDTCNLPIEQGPCAGNFSRWAYNSDSQSCEQFVWGGCAGNANKFKTEAACKLRCGTRNVVCSERQEAGDCGSKEAVWSFSQTENRCVPFYYTGCGGNGNKFDSRETCEQICPSVYVPDKCTLPFITGDCSDYRPTWFYDTRLQSCHQFYYGGCGGNKNNFDTEIECFKECSEPITTTGSTTTVRQTNQTQPAPEPHPESKPQPKSEPKPEPGSQPGSELDRAVSVNAHVISMLTIGAELRLGCEVDGFPEPNVYWTKDGQRLVSDERTSITGTTKSRLSIAQLTVSDSGLYVCHADNGYSTHSESAQIKVQKLTVPAKCTDNPFFANCDLIVRSKFCNHKYYPKFCCKSCVEAGQLDPQAAEAQADQPSARSRLEVAHRSYTL